MVSVEVYKLENELLGKDGVDHGAYYQFSTSSGTEGEY